METWTDPDSTSSGIPNPTISYDVTDGYAPSGPDASEDNLTQASYTFSGYGGEYPMSDLWYDGSNLVTDYPKIMLKKLPFYDIMYEIIEPTNLQTYASFGQKEATFSFVLNAAQCSDLASSMDVTNWKAKYQCEYQLQLRFCVADSSREQEDCFPPMLEIVLNGQLVHLPFPIPKKWRGLEPMRPPGPIHVTDYAKLSPHCINNFTVYWSDLRNIAYTVSLCIVKKLHPPDLLARLQSWESYQLDQTQKLIKETIDTGEADPQNVSVTTFKVSIACPIGKGRIDFPCRPKICQHLQCFDAKVYLEMNEFNPSWKCPVCHKPISFDDLVIDRYFQQVLNKMKSFPDCDGNDIEVFPDGTWAPIKPKKKPIAEKVVDPIPGSSCDDDVIFEDYLPPPAKRKPRTVDVTEADLNAPNLNNPVCNATPNGRIEVITVDSSDDEPFPETNGPEIRCRYIPNLRDIIRHMENNHYGN